MASNPDNSHEGTVANKGKGKQKDEPPQTTSQPASQDSSSSPSLLARITTSTTTLGSSLLSSPPSNTTLASATADKASASSSSQPSGAVSESSTRFQPAAIPSTTASQPFRSSSQSHTHAAAQERAFSSFLDDVPVFQPTTSTTTGPEPEQTSSSTETWHMSFPPSTSQQDHALIPSSAKEAASHDGEAVISLLLDSSSHLPDSFPESLSLTPTQAENLRQALFSPSPPPHQFPQESGQEGETDWNHILNFLPPYLRSTEGPNLDSYMDSGVADPAEAWDGWVGQWEGVLTRYHDEVWGDLGGLVEEARREVEELMKTRTEEGRGGETDTPALRRLRAILGHLRG